jgi:hypothetical protein
VTVERRILDTARSFLGMRELTGNNDGLPADIFMHGDRMPWCAGFVLGVLKRANATFPGPHWQARNVYFFRSWCKGEGHFVSPIEMPEPGWIVFYNSRDGSDAGPGQHMGFVEEVDGRRGRMLTIEGNYDNRVARVRRSLHRVAHGVPRGIAGYANPAPWAQE